MSIGNRLIDTGITSLGDSLHVVVNTHLAGDLRVDGDVSLGGELNVAGKKSLIDIPPGSWVVNLEFIANATTTHSGGYWIRAVLSTDCSSYTPPTFITGGPKMVAGVLTSNSTYGFLSGSVMVKNEGTTDVRMYVWRYWSESVNGADPNNTPKSFAKGVYNEDYIYAMPLNN